MAGQGRNDSKKNGKDENLTNPAEAKIHCDEAAGYLKNGCYNKALQSYNQCRTEASDVTPRRLQVSHAMTSEDSAKAQASKILGSNKESEFLQSFVRVDRGSDDDARVKPKRSELHLPKQTSFELNDHDQKSPSHGGQSSKQVSGKAIFKQIKKEMKTKGTKRRRARREEEVYTDKDRAAAVNMGSKDIKQSLSMKLKQDRTRALQLPDKADPNTLLVLGRNELKVGKIETAINFVNKALELNPEEKSALVARSKCYLLLGEPKLALEDAESALKIDKTYIKAIYQKAEALYYLSEFELSLMFYHRGLRLRPELEGFRLGVQKAQEAIENTIGHSRPLMDVASMKESPAEKTKSEKKTNRDRDRKLARQLLGQLCVDKEYLENLVNNPNLNVANAKSNNIIVHAEEAVEFLNKRQEFWRQQKPTAATKSKKSTKPIDAGPLPKWFDQNRKLS